MPVTNPIAVNNGGPNTAFVFPMTDPTSMAPMNIIGSYGANCWIYDPSRGVTSLQGRSTTKNWRRIHVPPRPTETPLMADCMWRGGGPDLTGIAGARPGFDGEGSGTEYELSILPCNDTARASK